MIDIEAYEINQQDFKKDFKKDLKSKHSGNIKYMINKETNDKIVMKKTPRRLASETIERKFYQEIETLIIAQHPSIIQFFGWFIDRKQGCICLKLAENGSLGQILQNIREGKKYPLWDETHKFIISYGIASALKYLHSKQIRHNNLKCENVLIDENFYPYVTDFNKTRFINQIDEGDLCDECSSSQFSPFTPIEYFTNNHAFLHSNSSDVYSYAMLLYCIWTEKELFPGSTEIQIMNKLMKNERPEFPSENVPPNNWRGLIDICWQQDPSLRPSFDDICNILESTDFMTESIDKELFESFKNREINIKKPESIPPYIDQLKKDANDGNADAQFSYALHLYNGLNVEQNKDEARRFFQLSADKGNAESQYYYSLILHQEGDAEKATEYYQKSLDSGCIEAYSSYAQQLIDKGKIDDSLQYLHIALLRGSMSALITYGNLCDLDNKYGCSDIFYDIASCCCHCLDSVGTYFPVDYKVFRCEDCDLEICEGCAKHCHKNHSIVEIGLKKCFVCDCGKNHFVNEHNKNKCSVEFVGEMKYEDKPTLYQHFFKCLDCCGSSDLLICKSCAEKCHRYHNVVDCGVRKGFCSCGTNKLKDDHKCKLVYTEKIKENECSCQEKQFPIVQRWFQCLTCGLYSSDDQGICINCSQKCHCGHALLDRGIKRRICQCNDEGECKFNK